MNKRTTFYIYIDNPIPPARRSRFKKSYRDLERIGRFLKGLQLYVAWKVRHFNAWGAKINLSELYLELDIDSGGRNVSFISFLDWVKTSQIWFRSEDLRRFQRKRDSFSRECKVELERKWEKALHCHFW